MKGIDYDDLEARLLWLASPDRPTPANQPPITTYVEAPEGDGFRVRATPEFDAWFDRTYVPPTDEAKKQRARVMRVPQVPREQTTERPGKLSRFKPT